MFNEGELYPNPVLFGKVKLDKEMLEQQYYILRTEGFIKVPTGFKFSLEELDSKKNEKKLEKFVLQGLANMRDFEQVSPPIVINELCFL